MPCAARGSDRCSRDHGPRHTRCAPEPRAAPRHAARGCRDRAQPHVLLPLSGVQPQGRRRPLDRRPARGPRRLRRSHAHRAAATRASHHHVAPPGALRPRSSRSSTAPRFARRSAAFCALFHRVALRVPVGRCPCARRRRLPRRAVLAAGAQRTPNAPSRRATGLRAIHARGRACRKRLGCRGFDDSTGRVGSLRVGRVA
jgi:hypothetical protein